MTPVVYSKKNFELNKTKNRQISDYALLGIDTYWINNPQQARPIDLLVCNPPYLPYIDEFSDLMLSHTVAGTDLLKHIIANGKFLAKEVYVNFSTIAKEEVDQTIEDANVELIDIGDPHWVPFRVPHALINDNYMKLLEDTKGMETKESGRYKYLMEIRTYKIQSLS